MPRRDALDRWAARLAQWLQLQQVDAARLRQARRELGLDRRNMRASCRRAQRPLNVSIQVDEFRIAILTDLSKARLTIPEAAFVSGLTAKEINREIDAKIVPTDGRAERTVRGADLIYLFAIKEVRTQVDPSLRKHMRRAIFDAVSAHRPEARVHHFVFPVEAMGRDLLGSFEALEQSRHEHIESRKDVLAGEPVIRGTRIAARHVADLIRRGASRAELRDDLELTDAQIEAALLFDRTSPKRGRPAVRKRRTAHVPAA
jgi:uncharacterized protein (DUF433 family)